MPLCYLFASSLNTIPLILHNFYLSSSKNLHSSIHPRTSSIHPPTHLSIYLFQLFMANPFTLLRFPPLILSLHHLTLFSFLPLSNHSLHSYLSHQPHQPHRPTTILSVSTTILRHRSLDLPHCSKALREGSTVAFRLENRTSSSFSSSFFSLFFPFPLLLFLLFPFFLLNLHIFLLLPLLIFISMLHFILTPFSSWFSSSFTFFHPHFFLFFLLLISYPLLSSSFSLRSPQLHIFVLFYITSSFIFRHLHIRFHVYLLLFSSLVHVFSPFLLIINSCSLPSYSLPNTCRQSSVLEYTKEYSPPLLLFIVTWRATTNVNERNKELKKGR